MNRCSQCGSDYDLLGKVSARIETLQRALDAERETVEETTAVAEELLAAHRELSKTMYAEQMKRIAELTQHLADANKLVRRFVDWSERRQAHVDRGYVSHEEHQAAVLALDAQRQAIITDARAAAHEE